MNARKKDRIEKADEDIYNDEQRDELMEEDAIEPGEAGFMDGYEHDTATKREIKKNLRRGVENNDE